MGRLVPTLGRLLLLLIAVPTIANANPIYIDQNWLNANPAPHILMQANTTYILTTDVTTSGTAFYIANKNITFDLNGHTINYGSSNQANKWGVCLYLSWHNSEISIPGAIEPIGAIIKNGTIRNLGTGDKTHGVYGNRAADSTISNLLIETAGIDSGSIFFTYGNSTILNNILISHSNASFNRHSGPANVRVGNKLIAHGNLLIGGNSGFVSGSNSEIFENVISHGGFVTNGYGGWFYRIDNVQMYDNIIIPDNGRGILANAGTGHLFEDNVILHWEKPNAEFGSSLNPPAIRVRYDAYNNTYTNNISLGIAGTGLTGTSSIYLSNDGDGPANYFTNNHASVILLGNSQITKYAQPVTLESQGNKEPSADLIANNQFYSNHLMLRVAGYDGEAIQGAPLVNNSFNWIDGSSATQAFSQAVLTKLNQLPLVPSVRASAELRIAQILQTVTSATSAQGLQPDRKFWYLKYSGNPEPGIALTLLDSIFGSGVNPRSYTYSTLALGSLRIQVGVTRPVSVLNGATPLANHNLTLVTDQADSFELGTDQSGNLQMPVIEFGLVKEPAQGAPVVVTDRTSSTVTADGFQNSINFLHNSPPDSLQFGEQGGTNPSPSSTPSASASIAPSSTPSPSASKSPSNSPSSTPSASPSSPAGSKLDINNVSISEGNSGTKNLNFTVTLNPSSNSTVTVNYATSNLTAIAGSDYVAKSGQLTFSPGQVSQIVSITINGDTSFESNETFRVTLSGASNASIQNGIGTGTILNDDAAPASPSPSASASLSPSASPSPSQGSSPSASPSASASASASIAPSSSPSASPSAPPRITNPTPSESPSATASPISTSGLSVDDVEKLEGTVRRGFTRFRFSITLSEPSANFVFVTASTEDATAQARRDYRPKSRTVTFSPGQTKKRFVVKVKSDRRKEDDEQFFITLSNPVNSALVKHQGTGTIVDDD